jgi:lysozyme
MSSKTLSPNGRAKIKQWEALRLVAYLDEVGKWTIGWGHTKGVKEGDVITKPQAEQFLTEDVSVATGAINKYTKPHIIEAMTQNQYDALVSFVFNVGPGGFRSSTLLKKLNKGDFDGVLFEFPRWNKGYNPKTKRKEIVEGLVNRRKVEADLWTTGQATGKFVSSNYVVPVPPVKPEQVTAAGASTATGLATLADPVTKVIDSLQTQKEALSSGDKIQMVIGGIIVLAGIVGLLMAWQQAGRPLPWGNKTA